MYQGLWLGDDWGGQWWGDSPSNPAATSVPFGPLRFRAWTTAAGGTPATSGLPFGPLRFRAWTSGVAPTGDAVTGLPFGPLRFREWTSGLAGPIVDIGGGGGGLRRPVDDRLERSERLRPERDDELMLWLAAAAASAGLLD